MDGAPGSHQNAFTSFLIAAVVGYVGILVFVFVFGRYGDSLTSGIDRACAEAAFQSGKEMEKEGNLQLAVNRYHEAIQGRFELQEREYECRRSLGELLVRLGRYEEAVDTYNAFAPEGLFEAGHWTGYVLALFHSGRNEEARQRGMQWLGKAQEAKDRQQEVWSSVTLGQVSESLGDLEDAFNYYGMADVLSPESDAAIRMATILKKLGKHAEAVRKLDAFLAKAQPGALREQAAALREECANKAVAQ
jgi:tetratricopeptide (TPR) repeat protein